MHRLHGWQLHAWLPSLIESNDILIATLSRPETSTSPEHQYQVRRPYWLMSKPPWSRLQRSEVAFN